MGRTKRGNVQTNYPQNSNKAKASRNCKEVKTLKIKGWLWNNPPKSSENGNIQEKADLQEIPALRHHF